MEILLIFIMAVGHALQVLFARLFNRDCKSDAKASPLVFVVLFGGAIGLITFAIGGFAFSPSKSTVIFGFTNAVILLIFNLSQISAAAKGSYAIMSISMLFGGILIPMIVSSLILDQTLRVWQIGAVVLMLVAFILLNANGLGGTKNQPGFWISCLLFGLSNGAFASVSSLQANAMQGEDRVEMIVISYFASAVLALIILAVQRRGETLRDFRIGKRSCLWALCCFSAAAVAVNLLLFVLSRANTTVTMTIDNGVILFLSVVFALVIFGEQPSKLQYAGLACALVSILTLSLAGA